MPPPDTVTLVSPEGKLVDVPAAEADHYVDNLQFKPATPTDRAEHAAADAVREQANPVDALGQGIARTVTFGGSDALQVALGGEGARTYLSQLREGAPRSSIAGEVIGGFAAPGVGELGAAIKGGGGFLRGLAAHGAEGALIGAGSGVSDLALSSDPVTLERAGSVLSSSMLFGGTIGLGAGALAKVAEKGLARAGSALAEHTESLAGAGAMPEELAGKSASELADLRKAEVLRIKAERVPQAEQLVEELGAFRSELKNERKLFLATKGIKEAELPEQAKGLLKINEIGKTSLDADKQIDKLLRNPQKLARRPEAALDALQQQETALLNLQKREPTLRALFSADESGARAAALDAVPSAIEKNRELQGRVRALMAEPASEAITKLDAAAEALKAPKPEPGLLQQMAQGSLYGHVAGLVGAHLPILGPMVGAKAAKFATDLVFGRLSKATAESAARTAAALEGLARGAGKAAPVIASKVLSSVRFAPKAADEAAPAVKSSKLADAYKERSAEIRSQTAYAPDGSVKMRPEARAAMAKRLDPVRHIDPVMADRMETIAARRLEYLSTLLPRRPDLPMPIGPDYWQPSDMAMRSFARSVAAVEDPGGVEERAISGSLTPEDAAAYRAVYPERAQDFAAQIQAKIPELRKSLPYAKRVSLSILTGVPVDPAMDPAVLAVLQSVHDDEPQTDGGTGAAKPAPQFGSVKKSVEQATPAQMRSQG